MEWPASPWSLPGLVLLFLAPVLAYVQYVARPGTTPVSYLKGNNTVDGDILQVSLL